MTRGLAGRRWALLLVIGLLLPCAARLAADSEASVPGEITFVGENLFATARGTFRDWRVAERRLDLTNPAESVLRVEVDLASVDTGNDRRDDHLRTDDFFDVEHFPIARVRVHSAERVEDSASGRPRFTVRYDIDLHGVQKTLAGEVELVSREPMVFEGELVVDRMEFGVGSPPSRWNPMSIKAEIPVRFRVEL